MSSPSLSALQQLRRLDKSSSGYHKQLRDLLDGKEYKQCMPKLQGEDLAWLVDYLDKTLDDLDPTGSSFRKCLRELRHICGTGMVLPASYTLPADRLDIGRYPIASGGSGNVHEGTFNGSKVCVKRARVYSEDDLKKATKMLYQEAVVWKRMKHDNIVPFLGITSAPLQHISDWMPRGDLTEYIKQHPDTDRLGLLCDVAKGLRFLHSRNIVHGDIKGPSILVDATGHARIADSGIAAVAGNSDSIPDSSDGRRHGTQWTAPEILNEQGTHSKEADVFSFAMVMVEVFTGAVPFNNNSSAAAVLIIMRGERPSRPTHPVLTDQLWALMQRCWDQNPRSRPGVAQTLQSLLTSDPPAWKQLISGPLSARERISLIMSTFSDDNKIEAVEHLSGEDAKNFVDTVYEALDELPQHTRRRCLRPLYRICGRQAFLPRSLEIPLCYDPVGTPLCHGGFADVWKCQYNGQEVAAKVLRVYLRDDLQRTRRRFCKEVLTWNSLRHSNVLPLLGVTMTENRFVMVSEWMANDSINEFVKTNGAADRLKLLGDVTKGLIYMHSQDIIHGDLKGANILINRDGRACLTDFSLVTVISDQQTFLSSCVQGGTIKWMSPELLDPEKYGLKKSRPTKESDCYALGMVVYEVLSGQTPFASSGAPVIIQRVLNGERPERPEGNEGKHFTDGIWKVIQLCWIPQPRHRVSAEVVLLGLEGKPIPRRPSSYANGMGTGPPTTRGNSRLQGGGQPPVPSQTSDPKEGWLGRNWKKLKVTTGKLF